MKDTNNVKERLVNEVVEVHPIVLGTEIHSNPFYVTPTELLGKEQSVAVLYHRLNHLATPLKQPKAGGSSDNASVTWFAIPTSGGDENGR